MIFRHTHCGVSDKDNNVSFEDFDIHYHISSYGLAAIPVIMSVSAFLTPLFYAKKSKQTLLTFFQIF
jgi:hypothetical protein